MNLLKTERIVSVALPDLTPVAHRIMNHFAGPEREVAGQPRMMMNYGYYLPPSWEISIHERSFRPIGQHRGALKIELVPQAGTTMVRLSAGVFGIPVGTEQLTWKVKLGQLWRDIRQTGLHDDALLQSEEFLTEAAHQLAERGGPAPAPPQLLPPGQPPYGQPVFAPPFAAGVPAGP
ncbi:hypothetical protein, partial [Amycolatopsis vancoresmycina]